MPSRSVLIDGQWRSAATIGTFRAENPTTVEVLPEDFPISTWADCEAALAASVHAAAALRATPAETIAKFLRRYAERIEARAAELIEIAHQETGLAKSPRLADVEIPRTTNQLRQAADAAISGSWAMPTIDTKINLRSCLAPIGPVVVFGPNNFPYAFNPVAGGDFAAAIASGNPVIGKAHPSHPATTRMLAEEALAAVKETGLHPATVQLIFHIRNEDGIRLVSDPRVGASGFTGSRRGGLALKAAADAAGKPIYLEMSSVNPVILLPGAVAERGEKLTDEVAGSCMLGAGQFCTNPGLLLTVAGDATEQFIAGMKTRFEAGKPGVLLSKGVRDSLAAGVATLKSAGAEQLTNNSPALDPGVRFPNTLLRVSGDRFLEEPLKLQSEAFGNATLIVVARDVKQIGQILDHLEGNLTGSIYSSTGNTDDAAYEQLAPKLRSRVGRLLNDRMPTGVAVSPAMNHGGPYPSTGHPGFTAVGIPASMRRFAVLQCFDNVRLNRLPAIVRNKNATEKTFRLIDGIWTTADILDA